MKKLAVDSNERKRELPRRRKIPRYPVWNQDAISDILKEEKERSIACEIVLDT